MDWSLTRNSDGQPACYSQVYDPLCPRPLLHAQSTLSIGVRAWPSTRRAGAAAGRRPSWSTPSSRPDVQPHQIRPERRGCRLRARGRHHHRTPTHRVPGRPAEAEEHHPLSRAGFRQLADGEDPLQAFQLLGIPSGYSFKDLDAWRAAALPVSGLTSCRRARERQMIPI